MTNLNTNISNEVKTIVHNHTKQKRLNLLSLLIEIQEKQGFVSPDDADFISTELKIPLSRIFSILSFYSYFSFQKNGKISIQVCDGTACRVKGSLEIIKIFETELGIKLGETTKDLAFSLQEVRCLGACALAPVAMINGKIYGNLNKEKIKDILKKHSLNKK
ncbi:MAG TPA: NAD(P)H-dependent oxidoreductase subunit E [Candidatus Woesearchaeota archaeon]|nr:NAD(P)H-dependent oxidoreductase subunit E [Candidatus Woesearchaeota archaeon]